MQKLSWYEQIQEEIKDDLKGFFKFRFSIGDGEVQEYNVWWEGLTPNVRIAKHDMPEDLFNRYKGTIESTARAESQKAFKEVIMSYMGR